MTSNFQIKDIPKTTVVIVAGPTASGKSDWASGQAQKEGVCNSNCAHDFDVGRVYAGHPDASSNCDYGSNARCEFSINSRMPSISDHAMGLGSGIPCTAAGHGDSLLGPSLPKNAVAPNQSWATGAPTVSTRMEGAVKNSVPTKTSGRIINGDSMQLYHGLDLLTAMPSQQDRNLIHHDLYGFLSPYSKNYTVAQWTKNAHDSVESAHALGQRAWIVGGTGFYLKTLTDGLSPIPPLNPYDKASLQEDHRLSTVNDLKKLVGSIDPVYAEKTPDKQRLLHAWIVHRLTGKALSWWHLQKRVPSHLNFFRVLIWPSREQLLDRAEKRWKTMVQNGVYEEVRSFCSHEQWENSPLRQAIGVRPIYAMLQGYLSQEECRHQYLMEIAQYIKQQRTWFRGQFSADYVWDSENAMME